MTQRAHLFFRLWLGQWLSNLGSQISFYGIGLWLFTSSDKLTPYITVSLAVLLSRVLVLPLLTSYLKYYSRRRLILFGYCLGGLVSCCIGLCLYLYGKVFPLSFLVVLLSIGSISEASLVLSFSTAIPQLVKRDSLSRANGFFVTTDSLVYLLAPFLGAICLTHIGIFGLLAIDLATFIIALLALMQGPQFPMSAIPLHPSERSFPFLNPSNLFFSGDTVLGSILFIGIFLMAGFTAAEILFPAWLIASSNTELFIPALLVSVLCHSLGFFFWHRIIASHPKQWLRVFALGFIVQSLLISGALFQSLQTQANLLLLGIGLFNFIVPSQLASQQCIWHQLIPSQYYNEYFAIRYASDWISKLITLGLLGLLVDQWLAPFLTQLDSSYLGSGPSRVLPVALGCIGLMQLLTALIFTPSLLRLNFSVSR